MKREVKSHVFSWTIHGHFLIHDIKIPLKYGNFFMGKRTPKNKKKPSKTLIFKGFSVLRITGLEPASAT